MTQHDTLEDLLAAQDQVFRAAQVTGWLTAEEVRAEVAAGRWQRPYPRVVVAHNGELTASQRRWAAVLAAPEGSVLGGLTAAEMGGLRNFEVPDTHLVVPRGRHGARRDGVVVRYSSALDERDVHPALRPPRLRVARSLLDAASGAKTAHHCRALLLAGVQQRLVRPDHYRDALARRGRCPRRALILEAVADAEGGIASVPEHDFEIIRRRFRLPEPSRQQRVRRRDGHYYLDADFSPYPVSAEVHGSQHLEVLTWDCDLDRINDLGRGGRRLLQFSSHSVRHRKQQVGWCLTDALLEAGWPG